MRPFEGNSSLCEKCGAAITLTSQYHKKDTWDCVSETRAEHLHHVCPRCSYTWVTAVKTPEAPPKKVGCAACLHNPPCPRTKSAKGQATDIILGRLRDSLRAAAAHNSGLPYNVQHALSWPGNELRDMLLAMERLISMRS